MPVTLLGATVTNFGRTWDAKKQLNEINKKANRRVQNIGDEMLLIHAKGWVTVTE